MIFPNLFSVFTHRLDQEKKSTNFSHGKSKFSFVNLDQCEEQMSVLQESGFYITEKSVFLLTLNNFFFF